ncbi:MAG: hypothetical protein ABI867_29395 [Kofleriaceae bacterium]
MKEILVESSEQLLMQARALLQRVDGTERAKELLEVIVARADGHTWGEAMVELSTIATWPDDSELSGQLAATAVGAANHLIGTRARAAAGVRLAAADYRLGKSTDLARLETSARTALLENDRYYGALGLRLLGDYLKHSGDKARARVVYEESAAAAERHEWLTAAASTLRDLAELEHEEGETPRAIAHLEQALTVIDRHPFSDALGTGVGRQRTTLAVELAALRGRT